MKIDLKKLYELAYEDGLMQGYFDGATADGSTGHPPDLKGFEKCVVEASISCNPLPDKDDKN